MILNYNNYTVVNIHWEKNKIEDLDRIEQLLSGLSVTYNKQIHLKAEI